jgi:hypothetical protein
VAEPREDERTPPQLEAARRNARYTYAQRRIKKIVDGMPPLTDEQLSKLAVLLHGGASE